MGGNCPILTLSRSTPALVLIDFAPGGQFHNPPRTHPRAMEILVPLEGTLLVGFVSSNQDNSRRMNAVAFAGLGSQDPGAITIADAVLDSKPLIMMVVLAKAFQLDVLGFSKEAAYIHRGTSWWNGYVVGFYLFCYLQLTSFVKLQTGRFVRSL
ncbi:unnamed protein product [Brassica oleracea var. botrytis]|uniref:Cupin type-1 domain-containing protein n=2 Tax=Brassica oleracea TaxID=3712 RepID=A0A0D3CUA7_BRAOL|nr:unnamed protein product [Brassica oleracea]